MKVVDVAGMKFGRLVALRRVQNDKSGRAQFLCKCECGNETVVTGKNLRSGNSQSCGCRKLEVLRSNDHKKITHGLSKTPEYSVWTGMKGRCFNRNSDSFHKYGGRKDNPITVSTEWMDFSVFIKDMGPRPGPKYTLERIDSDGMYEKKNCIWADYTTQNRNRSIVKLSADKAEEIRLLYAQGIKLAILCEKFQANKSTIWSVISGQSWRVVSDAIVKPLGQGG